MKYPPSLNSIFFHMINVRIGKELSIPSGLKLGCAWSGFNLGIRRQPMTLPGLYINQPYISSKSISGSPFIITAGITMPETSSYQWPSIAWRSFSNSTCPINSTSSVRKLIRTIPLACLQGAAEIPRYWNIQNLWLQKFHESPNLAEFLYIKV